MIKKVFIVSAVVFILAGISLAVFGLMPKKTIEIDGGIGTEEKTENGLFGTKKETSIEKATTVLKIVEGEVKGAIFDGKEGSVIFYNNKNFFKADADGQNRQSLLAYPFGEVIKIYWSKSADKVIVKDTEGFFLGYLNENRTEKIKAGADEVVFNTLGNKLIYKYYQATPLERSINIADLDGANWKKLVGTDYREIELASSPNKNSFLYFEKPKALISSALSLYNLETESEAVIFSGKFGGDYMWSPSGDKILVSYTLDGDKSKLSLGVMNASGGQFQGLNFPTSVDKCVWSKNNVDIFCAMMNNFPASAILPDDWQEGKYFSADTFWKINTENGEKTRVVELADLAEEIDSVNLFLDGNEKNLFLINKKNWDLYKIEL